VTEDERRLLEMQTQTALDASGAQNLTAKRIVMVTDRDNQEQRVAKLGTYFRDFLESWTGQIEAGVRMTPEIDRELATALIEFGAMILFAPRAGDPEPDEKTAVRCINAARTAVEFLIERRGVKS
jgi:hypothetical protein